MTPHDGAWRLTGCAADHPLGNTVGAIGLCQGTCCSLGSGTPGTGHSRVTLLVHFLPSASRLVGWGLSGSPAQDSYLVDSASSHMLVSKIKPCMSKYKQLYRETANGSLNQLSFI